MITIEIRPSRGYPDGKPNIKCSPDSGRILCSVNDYHKIEEKIREFLEGGLRALEAPDPMPVAEVMKAEPEIELGVDKDIGDSKKSKKKKGWSASGK
jgi:hypothetical protein